MEQLKTLFAGDLLVVKRHFPLAIHANAVPAAIAAEAAHRQGQFDGMSDLLLENQSDWAGVADPQPFFETYATQLNLDLDQFRNDQADQALADRVDRDANDAASLVLPGTPTYFLNGQQIATPAANVNAFAPIIQAALDADDSPFSLNRFTGQLFVADQAAIDFEQNPTFNIPVIISNGTTSNVDVTVNVIDVEGA